MASSTTSAKKAKFSQAGTSEVDAYMRTLDHPLKAEMEAVRSIILGASPRIGEGIKWNAPSFHTSEYFATFHPRAKDVVQVILHLGAKVKDNSTSGQAISDPAGLLVWLAKERATVKFRDMKAIKASKTAFADIVRQWIARVE